MQNRTRFYELESLAKPVAYFVNKPLPRHPKSSMAPRAVNELSEGTTSETSLLHANTGHGPMLLAIVHRLGPSAAGR